MTAPEATDQLFEAARFGNVDQVRMLARDRQFRIMVNCTDEKGRNAFMLASMLGQHDVVAFFLDWLVIGNGTYNMNLADNEGK
ncbi:hypothetical protein SPRG_21066, partial [Saprolegnia parasitica CBS 223.65]